MKKNGTETKDLNRESRVKPKQTQTSKSGGITKGGSKTQDRINQKDKHKRRVSSGESVAAKTGKTIKKEESISTSKALTVVALFQIRIIPMYLATIIFIGIWASYFYDTASLFYFSINEIYWAAGVTLLYTLSYLYHFCAYHRMFLHYGVANHLLSVVDTFWTIPLEDAQYFNGLMAFTGVMVAWTLYLYMRDRHKIKKGGYR